MRAAPGHGKAGDVVGVALQQLLSAILDRPQNHRRPQGVDQVLPARVHAQARAHGAWFGLRGTVTC